MRAWRCKRIERVEGKIGSKIELIERTDEIIVKINENKSASSKQDFWRQSIWRKESIKLVFNQWHFNILMHATGYIIGFHSGSRNAFSSDDALLPSSKLGNTVHGISCLPLCLLFSPSPSEKNHSMSFIFAQMSTYSKISLHIFETSLRMSTNLYRLFPTKKTDSVNVTVLEFVCLKLQRSMLELLEHDCCWNPCLSSALLWSRSIALRGFIFRFSIREFKPHPTSREREMDGRNPSCSAIGSSLVQSQARVLYNLSFGRKSHLLNDEIDLRTLRKLNEKKKRMFVWLIHFGSLEDEMNLIGSSYLFGYLLLSNNPRNMFRCLFSDSNTSFPFDLFQILD